MRFTERGDHGCESRDLWLQLDGNEVELRRLRASLVEGRFGAPGAYELDLTPASEAEVDFLVVHVRPGRSPADVKVTGVFRCSAVVDAHEDDPLYRGGLARFFTASTERTT